MSLFEHLARSPHVPFTLMSAILTSDSMLENERKGSTKSTKGAFKQAGWGELRSLLVHILRL